NPMGVLPFSSDFLDDLLGTHCWYSVLPPKMIGGSRVLLRRPSLGPVQGITNKLSQLNLALLSPLVQRLIRHFIENLPGHILRNSMPLMNLIGGSHVIFTQLPF